MGKAILLFSIIFTSITLNAQFWQTSEVTKLSGHVNSDAEESIPVFSKDDSVLYFVRTYDKKNTGGFQDQDVWYSTKDTNGHYIDCKRLKSVNNKFNNAVLGISDSGTEMYLVNAYDGKKDIEKGIAMATSKGDYFNWNSPEKINIPGLNIEGNYYGFHVSGDGKTMIISYAGPTTIGEEDLYISTFDGVNWSEPMHMGTTINSTGFEISPFLSSTYDTLFFSSNGFGGEGDADIFFSVKQGTWAEWSTPENLGSKINSPKFDAYFSHDGEHAFWSSNKDGENSDIYTLEILYPPLSITAISTDVSYFQGGDGSIDATTQGGIPPYKYKWSNGNTNEDPKNLAAGKYKVTVTDSRNQQAETTVFLKDPPPKEIEPVLVENYEAAHFKYLFHYNKNKLSISNRDLKRFVKEVETQIKSGRKSVTIKIHSSASTVPTQKFGTNDKLASIRAENMKYDLMAYFSKSKIADGKVNVVIVKSEVAGPTYDEDAGNEKRYRPFQFVELVTE